MLHGMSEAEVRAYARTLPHTFETRCSREVYFLNARDDGIDAVLKLAHPHRLSRYTYDQNVAEAVLWKLLPSSLRSSFAAVLDHADDGLWLLQEKVDPLWGEIPSELVGMANEVGVAELWPWNCGTRPSTGEIVVVDYGMSRVWEMLTGEACLDLIPPVRFRTTYLPSA